MDEQFDLEDLGLGLSEDEEEDQYDRVLVKMADGSAFRGEVSIPDRLSDELNRERPFLMLHNPQDPRNVVRGLPAMLFLNKAQIVWVAPAARVKKAEDPE
jgi:hypothetical protein